MKNVSHNNSRNTGAVQVHVDPPPIMSIKSNNDTEMKEDFVKNKNFIDCMSEMLDMYDLKRPCLTTENQWGYFFVQIFKMTLEVVSETPAANDKLQYLYTLLRGYAICNFDSLCD